MKDKPLKKNDNKSEKAIKPANKTIAKAENTSNEKIKRPRSKKAIEIKDSTPEIGIIQDEETVKSANKVYFTAIIVTIILTIFAYGFYRVAFTRAHPASDIATTAHQTLAETKNPNSQILTKKIDTLNSKKVRNKADLGVQISSRNLAHKTSVKNNEPHLQVSDFTNFKFDDNNELTFSYKLYNLGKTQVKAISQAQSVWCGVVQDTTNFLKDPFKNLNKPLAVDQYYYTREDALISNSPKITFPNGYKNAFEKGEKLMYFVGIEEYFNYITKKKRTYKYIIQLIYIPDGTISYKYVLNNNTDEK